MKLGGMILGLFIVGLFVGVFSLFFANLSENYSQDYNSTEYEIYQQGTSLNEQMSDINTTLNSANPESTDQTSFVTAFLGSGWSVIKTTYQSFGIMNTIGNAAIEKANLGSGTSLFKTYLMGALALVFFLTVIGVLVGKDLI